MYTTLSTKDLCLLMKILDAKTLIGVANPFINYTDAEMDLEWEFTFKKLRELQLVDLIDGELSFEPSFIQAMWIIARTNVVVETLTDDEDRSLFYFGEKQVIQCLRVTAEEDYQVYVHGTPEWTWQHIILPKMLRGITPLPTRDSETILVHPKDYQLYCKHDKIHNLSDLAAYNGYRDDSPVIQHFRRSIQRKIHTNRLMMFYNHKKQWNIEGLHVLSSPSYNWTLKMVQQDGQELLEAKQAFGESLINDILAVVTRTKGPHPV